MSTMRERVEERLRSIEEHHRLLKSRRYGFLVAPVILTVGTLVLIVGMIMIPFPGQGWLTVFLGVAILSLEARWARAVLHGGVSTYDGMSEWYQRQNRPVRILVWVGFMVAIVVTFVVLAWLAWRFAGIEFFDPAFDWLR